MTFNKQLLAATLLTAGGFAAISSANAAGSKTDSFQVGMTVISACTLETSETQNINFGEVAGNAAATDNQTSTTALSVMCSEGAPYVINLTPTSTNSTDGTGTMAGPGSDTIAYSLYSDESSTPWGNTSTLELAGNGVSSTGAGATVVKSHPVYASVDGPTDVQVGTYSDTVNVSVLY